MGIRPAAAGADHTVHRPVRGWLRAGAGAGGHGVFGPRPHHGNARVSAVRGALPPGLLRALALYFDDGAMETGGMPLRLIPTKTAAGTRALPAVRVRELVLEADGAPRRYTGVCAVFTPEPLADGGFCAIVPAEGGVCGA